MPNSLRPVLSAFKVGTTVDAAWTLPNTDTLTNSHLRDGDRVELEADTKGDFAGGSFVVPRGTLGHVTNPKRNAPKDARAKPLTFSQSSRSPLKAASDSFRCRMRRFAS
jgi:hypothetical protein